MISSDDNFRFWNFNFGLIQLAQKVDTYIDLHTHHQDSAADVTPVYNLMLNEICTLPSGLFSAGLHPWHSDQLSPDALSLQLDQLAANPNMVAIGETGLDKVCAVPFQLQQDIFKLHLQKAVEINKPIILHCVKAWDEMIEIASGFQLTRILHGYNGSRELTRRLLNKGFSFSIGKAIFDPKSKIQSSIKEIPLTSVFCETDDSKISIQAIYEGVGAILKIKTEDLRAAIFDNFVRVRSA